MKESTRASSCQLCRQTVNAIYPNRKANSMLSTLEGSCRWCNVSFPLNTAKQHVRECNDLKVICKACKQRVKRGDDLHDEVCPHRKTECDCGQLVYRGEIEEHRANACPLKKAPCSLNCGELVKR